MIHDNNFRIKFVALGCKAYILFLGGKFHTIVSISEDIQRCGFLNTILSRDNL